MSIEVISSVLFWTTVFHFALLSFWFGFFCVAHDFMYRFHSRWFKISVEKFDAIHYTCIATYKILIFVFSLAPWIALQLVISG